MYKWLPLKNIVALTTLMIVNSALASCASTVTTQPGSNMVRLAVGPVPGGCQLRGYVASGKAEAPIISHRAIQEAQLTTLKNQAANMGANVVFVTAHNTYYYTQVIVSTGAFRPQLDSHSMSGNAYYCTRTAINSLRYKTFSVTTNVYPNSDLKPGE